MQTCEVTELHYLSPTNPTSYPAHFGFTQNNAHTFEFNRLTTPLYRPHINSQMQVINPKVTCFSSNSTADEADEQQLSLINERKQSRMISNRESARRSRMRKQKHLNELCSQVVWLMNENRQLVDKLNDASECHEKVLQENVQLKEETSKLRQMLTGMQFNSPYQTLADLDDVHRNTSYLRTDRQTSPP